MEKYGSKAILLLAMILGSSQLMWSQVTASFTANSTQGCSPLVVSFSNTSTGAVSYKWDTGIGTSNLENPGVFYNQAGVYDISLIAFAADGSSDTMVLQNFISVFGPPVADFSISTNLSCAWEKVQFNDISTQGSGTITSWIWDFGDGNTSIQQNPVHPYQNPGTYPVSLVVTDQHGCSHDVVKNNLITVNAPDVSFTGSPLLACGPPLNTQFTYSGNSSGTHTWIFGDGNQSTSANPSHTYNVNGSFDVTHIMTDPQGCKDTLIRPAYVNIGVNTLSVAVSDSSVCEGDSVFFTTNASANSLVNWDFGNGDSATGHAPFAIYQQPGLYTATATISDGSGCSNTLSLTIEVFAYPIPDFTVADTTIGCEVPFQVDFINQSTGATHYLWGMGDGNTSLVANPSHLYNKEDTFTVAMYAIGPGGCQALRTKQKYIKVKRVESGFFADNRSGCFPLTTAFQDTTVSAYPLISWEWDFGDGNTGTGPNPAHTYVNPGSYDIRLITENVRGCRDTLIQTEYVTVGTIPFVDFIASKDTACALEPVQFTNLSVGASDFLWYFGDGDTAMSEHPLHGFMALDDVDVTLIASDRGCKDTLTKTDFIFINAPLPVIGMTDRVSCEIPITVTYTDLSVRATSFSWTNHLGQTINTPSFQQTFTQDGTYNVWLTVSNDSTGCMVTAEDSLIVHHVEADFTLSDSAACTPATIQFSDSSSNGVEWIWYFGTGDSARTQNPSYTYQDAGQYDITLIAGNKYYCWDTLVFSPFYAHDIEVDFAADDSAGCVPVGIQFTELASGTGTPVQWMWDFGDGNQSTQQHPAHTFMNGGDYPITLKVTDDNGCVDSLVKQDMIQASQPQANFLINPPANCPDFMSVFVSQSSGIGLTYLWDFGDGQTSILANTLHSYPDTGFYDVSLTVTDINGCTDTKTEANAVNIRPLVADFWADTTYAPCPPLQVQFTADNQFPHIGVKWTWDFGDGAFSNQIFPQHNYTQPGSYTVSLILETPDGCADTLTFDDMITIEGVSSGFTYSPASGCPGQSIHLEAINPDDSLSYEWILGDGSSMLGSSGDYVYQTPGTYLPILIVDDGKGCKTFNTQPDSLKIFAPPVTNFSSDANYLCDSGRVQFVDLTQTTDGAITQWSWSFGDGDSAFSQHPSHFYPTADTFDVSLATVDVNGCTDTLNIPNYVLVGTSPEVNISLSQDEACLPATIQFSSNVSPHHSSIQGWQWDLGNGVPGDTLPQTSFHFTQAGTYPISLMITDEKGCSAWAVDTLVIHPLPTAAFSVPDSFGCAPFGLSFTDLSQGQPTAWYWDFGDGGVATDSLPTYTYQQDGVYDVSLIVWDQYGCSDTLTKPQLINLSHPFADFGISDTVSCINTTLQFTNLSYSDTAWQSWTWRFGDGQGSTQFSPSHGYAQAGTYDVRLIVEDVFGCRDSLVSPHLLRILENTPPAATQIQYVSVLSDQQVEIIYEPYQSNLDNFGAYLILREDANGQMVIVDTVWNEATTRYVDGLQPTQSPLNTRTEVYCYQVVPMSLCGARVDLDSLERHCTIELQSVADLEQVLLTWNAYEGWPVEFYHIYRVSDYHPANAERIATIPGTLRTYLDTDMFCYDSYSYRVAAVSATGLLSYSDSTYAEPTHQGPQRPTNILVATVENNQHVSLTWQADTIEDPVEVVIMRNGGDGFKEIGRQPIAPGPTKFQDLDSRVDEKSYVYRAFTVDTCGDLTPLGTQGNNILLIAERTGGRIELAWEAYAGWVSGVEYYEVLVYNENNGQYETVSTVPGGQTFYSDTEVGLNQASSCYQVLAHEAQGNRTASLSNMACVALDPVLYSGNSFTPNGDGVNDQFVIKGSFIANFELVIYNRWGKKVFTSQNLDIGWDGTSPNQEAAPEGVYMFVATGKGFEGQTVRRTGSITLVR
ncbi:MAG: PKD domain-containing protein [Bacteroidota bacterium]